MWNEQAIEEIEREIVDEQVNEGFKIDSDGAAEWAIRKVAEYRADFSRMEIVCKNMIGFYQAKMAEAQKQMENKTSGLEGMLRGYFDSVPHKATKTQETYKLPSGTLKLKRGGLEYVRDEETLLPWVKGNAPAFVKTKESVDWAGLKGAVTVAGSSIVDENGEAVPGVTVVEKPDTFSIEL